MPTIYLFIFVSLLPFCLSSLAFRWIGVYVFIRNTMSNYLGRNGNANNVDNATEPQMA